MALLTLDFFSTYLCVPAQVTVLMPDLTLGENCRKNDTKAFYLSGKKYKVLWLLHGACCDHTSWVRYTNIERYVENKDMIVVMPSVLNSDYANYSTFADGFCVWDYFTEELMPLIYGWLPASDKPEDNYISGLSMGGNGALMLALGHPELFGGAAILSSTAREVEYLRPYSSLTSAQFRELAQDSIQFPGPNGTGMRLKEINQIAKYPTVEDFLNSCENAWDRFREVVNAGKLPKMYITCGTKDKNVYPRFLRFKEYAEKLEANVTFVPVEGFYHEWEFWDIAIRNALEFFDL